MSDQPPVGPDRPTPPPAADGPPPWGQQPGGQQPAQNGPYPGQSPTQPTEPVPHGPYGGQPQQQGPYGNQPQQQGPYQGQPQQGPYQGQPQQQGPYGNQPQQQGPGAGQPMAPYGPPAPQGTTQRRSKVPAIIAVALAAVLVLVGGGAFAYSKLGGGGAQPDEALPGNAVAYWRMDIDPSVGQKVAAVRFLSKLPKQKGDFTTGDFREKLWDAVKKESPSMKGVDYGKDIKPWLGDRMGVSVSAPARQGADPAVAVAVQVKDEDKAREGIDKILAAAPKQLSTPSGTSAPVPSASTDKPTYFFHEGYAVFTEPSQLSAVKDAIEDGTLSESDTFKADMDDLGEQGIMSGWFDMGALAKQAKQVMGPNAPAELDKAGRAAVALRFDSDYLELAGITRGQDVVKAPEHEVDSAITTLPDDTAVALSLSNGDELVGTAWDALLKLQGQQSGSSQSDLDQLESQYGLKLPADIKTLVGSNLVIAAPDQDFTQISGPDDVIAGVRVTTDASKAEDVMGKLEKMFRDQGSAMPITHRGDGDTFVASTGQPGLDWIAEEGKLGDTDAFRLAVPDAKKSQYIAYVDFDKVEHQYLGQLDDPEAKEFVKSFRSFGMSAHVTGDGEGEFSLRLVSN